MSIVINQKEMENTLLENLRQNNKKYMDGKESKNLVAVYEQNIFVWHDAGACLLTSQIGNNQLKGASFKVLTLTNPPVFEVDSLIFNQTGSLISLFGRNGVMIFEVPWRYGKIGNTGVNEENILGRSWNVAEYFFVSSNRVAVLQVTWHPGSPSTTHLAVLSSDNYIRIYDVTDPQAPQQVISLGADSRSSFLSSDSKVTFSSCFGENAVSFDFGPPEMVQIPQRSSIQECKPFEEETVWPIFLLHGNGDVYVLKAPLKKKGLKSKVKFEGPLAMYPPAEDNYGYDACSILCLHSIPVSLVVATSSGIMYHCLLLENSSSDRSDEQKFNMSWNGELPSDEFDASLYVFESVELPLSITEEQDDVYSHPIQLYKDVTSHHKYYCTHVAGVHAVAVPFLQALEESLETAVLQKLLTQQQKQTSIVEHILCTKPFSQVDAVPVVGVDITLSDAGTTMICLLASWEFVFLSLISSYFMPLPHLLSENLAFPVEEEKSTSSSFEQHIEKTLQRSLCSPFLKSFLSAEQMKTSPPQWLDLLCNVSQRFREDYVQRLSTAQALLRSRIKVLTQQKEYQISDISRCQQEKEKLRSGAERLAEKFEDAQVSQQCLLERIEKVLKKLQNTFPHLSKAEIEMKQTLLSYEEKLKLFACSLDQIKKKLKHQENVKELGNTMQQIKATKENLNNLNLNETQMKHIKELLSQESESIADLIKTVMSLKKQIGV